MKVYVQVESSLPLGDTRGFHRVDQCTVEDGVLMLIIRDGRRLESVGIPLSRVVLWHTYPDEVK